MAEPIRVLTFLASPEARLLVSSMLGASYLVRHGGPEDQPIEAIRSHNPDVVLCDVEMPVVSGLEIVCRIRKDPLYQDLLIVGLGSSDGDGMDKVALVAGCSGFIAYPLDPASFPRQIRDFLFGMRQELALDEHLQYYRLFSEILIDKLENRLAAIEKKNRVLEEERERQNSLMLQVLTSLVTLIEAKDPYLKGHSGRVTTFALMLAKRIGFRGRDLVVMERAAMLHDIGKISIDLKQINKPGPLSPEEWEIIRQHPNTGYRILASIDFLQDESLITLYHHYMYKDFESHPEISSRIRTLTSILTIMDSFDAMTTHRSYNKPLSYQGAVKELRRCAATQFDPALVDTFVSILEETDGDPRGIADGQASE